ncbi:hypothetical protein ACFFIX_00905 [Metabacillus herbersteinensis]|uniref:LysM domain-containing protein n=1 Tax=Metabacillus herbersteinensis TaxID=283816 RepID=A0ABV6G8P1_9BACI
MKRLAVLVLALFLSYIIYYDFSSGTLPTSATPTKEESSVPTTSQETIDTDINYFEVKINEGDTVLSIIERTHSSLPVSIETIISDFEKLNPGEKAESITIGSTYKFQKYTN